MHNDGITIRLRLGELAVTAVNEQAGEIEVVTRYRREEASCPRCGRATWQVHQWHRQRKKDAKLWEKPVYVVIWKRRFRCRACRQVFTEEDPVCGRRRRTTQRLRGQAARQAEEATVRAVARWNGVSEGLVQRSWREAHSVVAPSERPHVFLGIDGFCVRSPGRMWTGMWDLESRRPVAIVPGARQSDVQRLLERHAPRESVKAVVIDLSEPYRQALELVLPDTAIVADKFHVIALASRALREVHGERRQRGSLAWLLQRGVERLRREERSRLVEALKKDPALARAWALKESLRSLYRQTSGEAAAAALGRWISEAEASQLPAFRRTAATLRKWQQEVLNYWRFPLTNAIVEGKHNRVKVVKRRAYGYRNDGTFLLRILNLFHTN